MPPLLKILLLRLLDDELYPYPVLDVDEDDEEDFTLEEYELDDPYPEEPERSRIFVAL